MLLFVPWYGSYQSTDQAVFASCTDVMTSWIDTKDTFLEGNANRVYGRTKWQQRELQSRIECRDRTTVAVVSVEPISNHHNKGSSFQ